MSVHTAIANSQIDAESYFDTVLAAQYRDNVEAYATNDASGDIIGLDPIASYTPSAVASLDITGVITSAYDKYIFEFIDLVPATDSVGFYGRISDDDGATWKSGATDYDGANSFLTLTPASAGSYWGSATGEGGYPKVILSNPNSATLYKPISGSGAYINNGGTAKSFGPNTMYTASNTLVINAIQFYFSSGNIESGSCRVYGVRT